MTKKKGFIESVMANAKIVFIIVGLLVVLGVFGLFRMNKDEYPSFVIRQGIVAAVYPGASVEEVEQQLTTPLEEYLFTYQEVDKDKTYSYTKEGITYIYVELVNSVRNQTEVWSKLRHGLKDFKQSLPAGVLGLVVVDDFGNTSSLLITMDAEGKSYADMQRYMTMMESRLRRVPTVGNLRSLGGQQEEVAVWVDPARLATYGISQPTLAASMMGQGLLTMSGSIEDNDGAMPIHVASPFRTESEIANLVVMALPSGQTVRLKDVATIERRYSEPSSYITKDGRQALVLSVEMRQGNNIVQFGRDVDDALADFQRTLPDGVNLYRITDLPQVVDESIWGFMRDLITAILVVIAVMLLLFPLSSALIPAIEIPLTTAITIGIMYLVGYEMNIVTLAALIVTLGMIVDDSIVMIDGYMDNLRRGFSPQQAAVASAKTFFPSLLVATIAISGIFFPYLFTMHGPLGDFVKFFPTTISLSLGVSLALAMLLTPWLEKQMIGTGQNTSKTNWASRVQSRFFAVLQGGYEWLLQRCFRHPWATIALGIGSVVAAVAIFMMLPLQLMPKAERDSFAVEILLPEGATLQQTAAVCTEVEQMLEEEKEIESITTFVGSSSPRFMATYAPKMPGANYGQMIVKTTSNDATESLVARYKDSCIDLWPEASVRIKQLDYQAVANPVEVRLMSDDLPAMRREAERLMQHMREMDELVWVHSDCDGTRPTLDVTLKPDESSRLGISKATLEASMASLYGGMPVATVWDGDRSMRVVLYSGGQQQADEVERLRNLMVPTALPQVWVPLRQVADVSPSWEPSQIAHRNGVPCITVGADLRFGISQPTAMKRLRPWLEKEFLPTIESGVEMRYGGLDDVNSSTMGDIIIGLVASVMIVFFFLLFNFKKIRLTVLALCGTLLCLFGAFLGLWVFGCDVSLTAIIGIVSLIGINVRNTIVMFDYAEELREAGGSTLREVAFEAGRRRMRPIFLTSATTAVGVIPMIIHGSSLWMPMGVVICFGTLFAIGLIVTVMPVAYWKLFGGSR